MMYTPWVGRSARTVTTGLTHRDECDGTKKAGAEYLLDISATRLSL
jgi:hypothetical protein